MARLPIPGSDRGTWGDILNTFLSVEHNSDGTLKTDGSLASKADDDEVVHIAGSEVILGNKDFLGTLEHQGNAVVDTTDPRLTDHRPPMPHQDSHQSGGSDALTGDLDANARINVRKDGISIGTRRGINFIEGSNVAITTTDSSASERVNVTIAATNAVESVNGETGVVVLDKGDIGLSNVDNTSDADKPISTATQTALDAKQDDLGYTPEDEANKSSATTLGTSDSAYPTQNAVKTYVDTNLSDKADTDHTHTVSNITDLTASATELNYTDGVTGAIQPQLDGKQPLDPTLTALASVSTAANKLPYFSGTDVATTTDLTTQARALLDDPDAATMRETLLARSLREAISSVTTGPYTPQLTDEAKILQVNSSSPISVVIPTNATVGFPVGTWFKVMALGSGTVTIDGTAVTMLNSSTAPASATSLVIPRHSEALVRKGGTDTWVVTLLEDTTLIALSKLTTAADKLIYATGSDTFATTDLSSFSRTLLDDTTAAAARATLEVPRIASGTASQAVNANTKTATIAGYTLATGDFIALTLTNGNTATSPTLNVNGTGAVTIQQTSPSPPDFDAAAGAIWLLYYTGSVYILLNNGDPVDALRANRLVTGMENFSREFINGDTTVVSQRLNLTYFTCEKIFTATQLRTVTGSVAAGATPTTCKMGLYQVNADNTLTLLAKTANNTALWAAANTVYTEPFESGASVEMTRNQRYAFAILINTAAATPTFLGQTWSNGTIGTYTPRLAGEFTGQTDIPSSLAAASGTASSRPWSVVLP